MRKITWILTILVVLGIFFATNVLGEDAVYKLTAMKGKVLLKRAGTQEWIEAKLGDILNKNDSLKTLEDGSAFLETGPNTGFTLGPNSEFIVANTFEEPPVAEPYSEPAREGGGVENVVAPGVNQESAASQT